MSAPPLSREARWRLILGQPADEELPSLSEEAHQRIDESLDLLFDPDKQGQLRDSLPRLHRWLGDLRELFPPNTLHYLQREAFDRLGIADLLLQPEIMRQLEPDLHLAGVLLQSFKMLDETRRQAALRIIHEISRQLLEKLRLPLLQAMRGRRLRHQRRSNPPWAELDWNATIRRNLRHYQPEYQTILPVTRLGYRQQERRQKTLIILVDQSGSMSESLIYAGLYANILSQIPSLHLVLLAFDVKVLDLTPLTQDPVDLLLGFHMGGGTDIGNALIAARSHVTTPEDTLIFLISDLFEGGSEAIMLTQLRELRQAGCRILSLLTLSSEGNPSYDLRNARLLQQMDIPAFACSPDQFPEVMARALQGDPAPAFR